MCSTREFSQFGKMRFEGRISTERPSQDDRPPSTTAHRKADLFAKALLTLRRRRSETRDVSSLSCALCDFPSISTHCHSLGVHCAALVETKWFKSYSTKLHHLYGVCVRTSERH